MMAMALGHILAMVLDCGARVWRAGEHYSGPYLHFWHWKTKTRMARWTIVLDIGFISGCRVDDFTRHSNRVAGHGQCDARLQPASCTDRSLFWERFEGFTILTPLASRVATG